MIIDAAPFLRKSSVKTHYRKRRISMAERKLTDLVTTLEPTHSDSRRTILEYENSVTETFQNAVAIKVTGNEPVVLGNHYHARKNEVFLLLQGKIKELILINVATGEQTAFYNLGPLTKIVMPHGTAHRFTLAPKSTLLVLSTLPYDKSDDVEWKNFRF